MKRASIDADALAAAVAEFPDLAYYLESGRASDARVALGLAEKLRTYDPTERVVRVETLRRSIDLARRKRDGTYVPKPLPSRVCRACGQTLKSGPR